MDILRELRVVIIASNAVKRWIVGADLLPPSLISLSDDIVGIAGIVE